MAPKNLPLRWTRLVVLSMLTAVIIVANLMFMRMVKIIMLAKLAVSNTGQDGVTRTIDFSNVQSIAGVVFATLVVMALIGFNTALLLMQDMFHIVPNFIARRLRLTSKTLSTSTLAYQAIGLACGTIALLVPLSLHTASVFTKEAIVTITENGVEHECPIVGTLNDMCLQVVYAETPYIRLTAELPWPGVLMGIAGTLVTFAAWYKRSNPVPDADVEATPSVDSKGSETRVNDVRMPAVESYVGRVTY